MISFSWIEKYRRSEKMPLWSFGRSRPSVPSTPQRGFYGSPDVLDKQVDIKDADPLIPISIAEVNHHGAIFEGASTFTARDATFESRVGQAIALSPAMRERLLVDAIACFWVDCRRGG
jgi:hypothetical protein